MTTLSYLNSFCSVLNTVSDKPNPDLQDFIIREVSFEAVKCLVPGCGDFNTGGVAPATGRPDNARYWSSRDEWVADDICALSYELLEEDSEVIIPKGSKAFQYCNSHSNTENTPIGTNN